MQGIDPAQLRAFYDTIARMGENLDAILEEIYKMNVLFTIVVTFLPEWARALALALRG